MQQSFAPQLLQAFFVSLVFLEVWAAPPLLILTSCFGSLLDLRGTGRTTARALELSLKDYEKLLKGVGEYDGTISSSNPFLSPLSELSI